MSHHLINFCFQGPIAYVVPVHQTLAQRQTNFLAGRHLLYDQVDLNRYKLVDIPLIVVHNGHNHFIPAKPLKTENIVAMRNHQIYHGAVLLRYMLRRAITSHLKPDQNRAWHIINDALLEGMWAFAPEDIVMRKEYEGGPIEQITRPLPPRPPTLPRPTYTVSGDRTRDNLPTTTSHGAQVPNPTTSSTTTTTATSQSRTDPTATASATASATVTSPVASDVPPPIDVPEAPPVVSAPQATQRKVYKCYHCDRVFTRSNHRQQHVDVQHKEERIPCEQCSKTFSYERGLQEHINIFHKAGTKHKCTFEGCNYANNNLGLLEHHISTQHEHKIYECDICGKPCKSRYARKEHLRKGPDCALLVKWHCPKAECGAKCRTQRTQRSHVRKHHKELLPMLVNPSETTQEEQVDENAETTEEEPMQATSEQTPKVSAAKPPTGRPVKKSVKQKPKRDTTPLPPLPQLPTVADDVVITHVNMDDFNPDEPIITVTLDKEENEQLSVAIADALLESDDAVIIPPHPDIARLLSRANILTTEAGEIIARKPPAQPEVPDVPTASKTSTSEDAALLLEQKCIDEALRLDKEQKKQEAEADRRRTEEAENKKREEEQALQEEAIKQGELEEQARIAKEAEDKAKADQKRKDKARARKKREDEERAKQQAMLFLPDELMFATETGKNTTDKDEERRKAQSNQTREQIIRTHELFRAQDVEEAARAAQKKKAHEERMVLEEAQRQKFEAFKREQQKKEKQRQEQLRAAEREATPRKSKKHHKKSKSRRSSAPAESTSHPSLTDVTPQAHSTPSSPTAPTTATVHEEFNFPQASVQQQPEQQTKLGDKRRGSSDHTEEPPAKAIILTAAQKEQIGVRQSKTAVVGSDSIRIIEQNSPPAAATSSATTSTATVTTTGEVTKATKSTRKSRAKKHWDKLRSWNDSNRCNICGAKFYTAKRLLLHMTEKHGHTEI